MLSPLPNLSKGTAFSPSYGPTNRALKCLIGPACNVPSASSLLSARLLLLLQVTLYLCEATSLSDMSHSCTCGSWGSTPWWSVGLGLRPSTVGSGCRCPNPIFQFWASLPTLWPTLPMTIEAQKTGFGASTFSGAGGVKN